MEKTNLNLIPEKEKPIVNASQFDDGRVIRFILKDGEGAYIPVGGESVSCNIRKPDNNIVTISCTLTSIVEDEETIGSYVDVVLTEQANACVGEAFGELVLTKEDNFVIGTCNFVLAVERSPIAGGVTSTTVIDDLYTQVEEITVQVIGDNYYTKTQVDDLLDLKADAATTYTKTEVDTALALKADAATTYTKTEVDTALALKANTADLATVATTGDYDDLTNKPTIPAAQVQSDWDQSDNTKLDYIKNKPDLSVYPTVTEVGDLLYDMLPVGTASGAIANFDTDLALPLVDCKANIVASGGGGTPVTPIPINGYTEVNITRCGVNLFDRTKAVDGIWNSDGTYSTNNTYQTIYSRVKPSTTYTISGTVSLDNLRLCEFNTLTPTTFTSRTPYNGASYTFTTSADTKMISISPTASSFEASTSIQLEEGSPASAYTPYNGNTYTIAFGQTVYGGVFDVTSGKLRVTHIDCDLSTLRYSVRATGTSKRSLSTQLPSLYPVNSSTFFLAEKYAYKGATTGGEVTADPDSFESGVYSYTTGNPTTDYIYFIVDDLTATSATGKLVYELATPFDIDLTPTQINAIVGTNNIYNDTNGDTEVKYKDTIQHYIDTRI